MTNYILNLRDW